MENENMSNGFDDSDSPDVTIATRPADNLVREGFGSTEMQRQHETMSTALASAAKAQIEAQFIMAIRNPRNPVHVRERLLTDCRRPAFADVSMYKIKRGKVKNTAGQWVDNFIEGPTIRFAEAARTAFRNLDTKIFIIYDDDNLRLVQVTTTDLETNITESATVNVAKTVERKQVYESHEVLAVRTTSEGGKVYIVRATAEEVNERQNSLVARVKRGQILTLIPGDLKAEAIQECYRTMSDANRKQIVARRQAAKLAFEKLGVSDPMLTGYLGHPIVEASAEELDELQTIYNGIREGETSWAAATASKTPEPAVEPVAVVEPAPEVVSKPKGGNAAIHDALRKAAKEQG
jgi:hypothetical protein